MSKKLGQKRRKFSQEFKQDAVKLVINQGMKCTEAARDLGVDQNTLSRWVAEFKADGPAAFPGKGHLKPDDQRLKNLEARPCIPRTFEGCRERGFFVVAKTRSNFFSHDARRLD